jgi:hypothetical protein
MHSRRFVRSDKEGPKSSNMLKGQGSSREVLFGRLEVDKSQTERPYVEGKDAKVALKCKRGTIVREI